VFTGHIKVLGGPHVARGPDVAQACPRPYLSLFSLLSPPPFILSLLLFTSPSTPFISLSRPSLTLSLCRLATISIISLCSLTFYPPYSLFSGKNYSLMQVLFLCRLRDSERINPEANFFLSLKRKQFKQILFKKWKNLTFFLHWDGRI
jgi:hypothetical protein